MTATPAHHMAFARVDDRIALPLQGLQNAHSSLLFDMMIEARRFAVAPPKSLESVVELFRILAKRLSLPDGGVCFWPVRS
jgi:hypothetical protein